VTAGALFGTAWRMPFRHMGALLRSGALPLLIAIIASPPNYNVHVGNAALSLTNDDYSGWDILRFLISLPCIAAFAAAWIRLIVYLDEADMGGRPIALDWRTWQVTWAFLRLIFVALGVLIVLCIIGFVAFGHYENGDLTFKIDFNVHGLAAIPFLLAVLVVLVVFAWFMLRLSMVIPAAAVGEQGFSLRASWQLTAPLHGRLLGAAILLGLAYGAITIGFVLLLAAMLAAFGLRGAFYGGLVPLYLLYVFGNTLWAGLLGAAYGTLAAVPTPNQHVANVFR